MGETRLNRGLCKSLLSTNNPASEGYKMNAVKVANLPSDLPILIAGPTASGKSALALQIAEESGGIIINADALQVFDAWRILTARPDDQDLKKAQHYLYGHIPFDGDYSVGHWLRDLNPFLSGPERPIIIGGTGLYFTALTEGLAEIPAIPQEVRAEANLLSSETMLGGLDTQTAERIDTQNRVRVQRAWEVFRATGRTLTDWQNNTPPAALPLNKCIPITILTDKKLLNTRIEKRFDLMIEMGALDEARKMLPHWNPSHLSSRAIGASELIDHLKGNMSLKDARDKAIVATHQYAKRQRTWLRSRMKKWQAYKI